MHAYLTSCYLGVTHNIPLLRDVLMEKVFTSGVFMTFYLPDLSMFDLLLSRCNS